MRDQSEARLIGLFILSILLWKNFTRAEELVQFFPSKIEWINRPTRYILLHPMTWKRFLHLPSLTQVLLCGDSMCSLTLAWQRVEQPVELPAIWNTITFVWSHSRESMPFWSRNPWTNVWSIECRTSSIKTSNNMSKHFTIHPKTNLAYNLIPSCQINWYFVKSMAVSRESWETMGKMT